MSGILLDGILLLIFASYRPFIAGFATAETTRISLKCWQNSRSPVHRAKMIDGTPRQPHRGRFQAQSKHFDESEVWAQTKPLLASAGRRLLDTLEGKLARGQREARQLAFQQAHEFINRAEAVGGTGPMKKTFPNRKLKGTEPRVDIEVNAGLAFITAYEDDE